jgi:hypothetical protein
MKCDKLKAEPMIINDDYMALYYPKDSVDAAIEELKREHHKERDEYIEMVDQHKAKLVEQESENRRLKRSLWMARADRAKTEYNHWILIWHCELNNHLFFINKTRYKNRAKVDRLHYPWEWRDIWDEVERKCRAKAEEYK